MFQITFWYVAAVILAIIFLIGIIGFMHFWAVREAEKRIWRFQDDLLKKHYDEVENMYRKMRGWRHDYRNHIQVMKAYLAQKNYDQLDCYLDELAEDLTTVETVIKTGNTMIDAILSSKISAAKEKKIRMNVKAIVPKQFECSSLELCVVIGNLMDNAIEACMKLSDVDKRFIRVYIDVLKGKFYCCITNSMDNSVKKKNGIYYSTKIGKDHGFGLMRIDDIVKKYGGFVNRKHEDGVFAAEVVLPVK